MSNLTPRAAAIQKQIRLLEDRKKIEIERIDKAIRAFRDLLGAEDLLDDSFFEVVSGATDEEDDELMGMENDEPTFVTGTLFERCLRYFSHRNNMPATNAMIRHAIGSSRGSVAMVLYNTHPDCFLKVNVVQSRHQHWQLSPKGKSRATELLTVSSRIEDESTVESDPNGDIPF